MLALGFFVLMCVTIDRLANRVRDCQEASICSAKASARSAKALS